MRASSRWRNERYDAGDISCLPKNYFTTLRRFDILALASGPPGVSNPAPRPLSAWEPWEIMEVFMSNRILLSGLVAPALGRRRASHPRYKLLLAGCCVFALFAGAARAEKLYFIPGSGGSYNSVANWYVPGPNNTFTLAGR